MEKDPKRIAALGDTSDPYPTPTTIFRVESYQDSKGRLIIAKWPWLKADPATFSLAPSTPTFIGQGVAGVQVMTNQGVQVQQVPFEVPLPGPTIHDAFDQFDKAQEPAFRAHMDKMRLEALKQGADLSQLPKAHRN